VDERRSAGTAVRCLAAAAGLAALSYATYVTITWLRFGRMTRPTEDEVGSVLDQFLAVYDLEERHQTRVAAPPDVTFVAASDVDIRRVPMIRALFKGRELLLGGKGDEGERPRTLLTWMQSLGWTVLVHVPGRQVVLGTVMRPWEPDPSPRVVAPEEFAAFLEPGYVKIVSTWAALPAGSDGSQFTIATRVATTDATARRLFRRYWSLFSPGSLLIRYVGLRLVRDEAERQAGLV